MVANQGAKTREMNRTFTLILRASRRSWEALDISLSYTLISPSGPLGAAAGRHKSYMKACSISYPASMSLAAVELQGKIYLLQRGFPLY